MADNFIDRLTFPLGYSLILWHCTGVSMLTLIFISCLQGINSCIKDPTLSDIIEATKSKFYDYDTDWESKRMGRSAVTLFVALFVLNIKKTVKRINLHYRVRATESLIQKKLI